MTYRYFVVFGLVAVFALGCKKEAPMPSNPIAVVDLESEIEYIEHNLIKNEGDTERHHITDRMECHNTPGVSIAVVEGGVLKWAKGYGVADADTEVAIDTSTLFQAASISKPLAALAALKLVEGGQIDLDEDVNTYLQDWQVPQNEYTSNEKVTLRRLLSHTAGTNVPGYAGYAQSETLPTLDEVLDGDGNSKAMKVNNTPGEAWSYSGGGYSIMEKVVEDVSGMPLEAYFEQHIAGPLGMTRSRFEQPLPDQLHTNASSGHSRRGKVIAGGWRNYPEQAAAGLWTTPADLAKYCIEVYEIYNGKTNGILQPTTIELMLTEEMGHWGLGPELGNSSQQNKVFKHNGSNEGFKTQFIAFADSGNAVVILTNGEKGYSLVLEILMGLEAYYGWDLL